MISHRSNFARAATSVPPTSTLVALKGDGCREWRNDLSRIATGLAAALDQLDHGIMLLTSDCQVLFASAGALDLVAQRRGLVVSGRRLLGGTAASAAALRNLVARCASSQADEADQPVVLQYRIGNPPLLLAARRVEETGAPGLVILFVSDPIARHLPDAGQLRRQFALTRSESLLAVDILSGEGLTASARRLGIAPATARTHLNHILRKTGTRRQAELVRVLAGARLPLRPVATRPRADP